MIQFTFLILMSFSQDWSSIYSSQSHEELLRGEIEVQKKSHIDTRCQLEREQKLFPMNCFLYLDQQLENPITKEDFFELRNEVLTMCVRRADQLMEKNQIEQLVQNGLVQDECRVAVTRRLEDLIYIEEKSMGSFWRKN